MPFDYRDQYTDTERPWSKKNIKQIHFPRPEFNNPLPIQHPSCSKVTRCLIEEFKLEPIPELYHYEIHPSQEAIEKGKIFRAKLGPYGIVHYQGVSSGPMKELTHYEAGLLLEFLKPEMRPILLDFKGRSPMGKMPEVYHLTGNDPLWLGRPRFLYQGL